MTPTPLKISLCATLLLSSALLAQPAAPQEFAALIGLWRAGTEAGIPTLTIDGTAAPKASGEHATRYFGADGPAFVGAANSPTIFPLAAASAVKAFSNGELRVEFKLVAGATDQTAGIAFNLRADHSYLYARYNTKDGNVALWKYEKGERTVLAHGDLHEQLPFNVWHTLRVVVEGRKVVASVNDRFQVSHTIDRDVAGGVGLWTKADSVTAFRQFSSKVR